MNGASREALAAARERLDALTDNTSVDAARLADELAAVTALLAPRGLAAPGPDRPGAARRGQGRAGPAAARRPGRRRQPSTWWPAWCGPAGRSPATWWTRWRSWPTPPTSPPAERDGSARRRRGRAVPLRPDRRLQHRAARRARPTGAATAAAKAELLRTLLGGRARPVTERLVTRLVTAPRGRSLEAGLESLSKLAAARRDRMVAVVTSAVPLSDAQKQRLGDALAKIYGRQVHLNLDVDPEVLGGVRVRVGDEVINGTIADRLDEAGPPDGGLTAAPRHQHNKHDSGPVGPCRRNSWGSPPDPQRNFGPNKESREPRWRSSRSGRRRSGTRWRTSSSRTSRTRPRARRSVRSALPATASRRSRACPRPWRTNC